MKPIEKPLKSQQKPQCDYADKANSNKIHVTLVSEKERNIYRIPSYGYILP